MTAAAIYRFHSGGAVLEVRGEREIFADWRLARGYAKQCGYRLPTSGVPPFLPHPTEVIDLSTRD